MGPSGNSLPHNSDSWKEAWLASPGPDSLKQGILLFSKGFCMGTADIIPGVSGGTVAFITGIYEQLLSAITSIDVRVLGDILRGRFQSALSRVHLRFLLILLSGILAAVICTARLMYYLLSEHPEMTWSLFFGLITASILVVGRSVQNWRRGLPGLLFGTLAAYVITGMIPVHTPESHWFLFLSGLFAICAMILPGLSGAFILLILGKYAFITSVLRDPFSWEHLQILFVFLLGCLTGILGFSRVLRYGLARFRDVTLGMLTGFMIGALRKVWPWKIPLETEIIRGREYVVREINVLPQIDDQLTWAAGLILLGFFFVILLESRMRGR